MRTMRCLLALFLFCLLSLSARPALAAQDAADDSVTITILGSSDVHGRFLPWDYAGDTEDLSGSFAQISTVVKEIRAKNPNTILLDCGDTIQDNSVEQFNTAPLSPMVAAMNAMKYDAWEMGNHEFNFGLAALAHVTRPFRGALLCGNVYNKDGNHYLPASVILERAGVRIGIIGMDTPMIAEFEKASGNLASLDVRNPRGETAREIAALQGKTDALIGLFHMGVENENGIADTGVRDIVNACPALDAVIAGHMHQNIPSETINGVLISEPYRYGRALTRIDLRFAKKDGRYLLVEKTATTIPMKGVRPDPAMETLLAPFHAKARAFANETIGNVVGDDMVPADTLPGVSIVQLRDTPLTSFFNKVQLHYSGADVVSVIISRNDPHLDKGPIRRKDIAYNYEYSGGETTVYEITGRDLKDYMEWSAGYFNQMKEGDVTPSYDPVRRASKYSTNDIFGGVSYEVDLREPKGRRIKNLVLTKTEKPIGDRDKIRIGMNAYRMNQLLAKGGIFEGRTIPAVWSSIDAFGEDGGTIRNMAIRYIKDVCHGTVSVTPANAWRTTGYDESSPDFQEAVRRLKDGTLRLNNSADGKSTNIASITKDELLPQ